MANRYWVGGTGNWSDDTNHWATSSGGSPGAGNKPTSSDNAIFDSSSNATAYTVTINEAANCLDLNFSSAPSASGTITWAGTFGMSVYGNLTCLSGMTRTISGVVTLAATTTGKTVTTNSVQLGPITFNGAGGGWTLQDNLTCQGGNTFRVDAGTVDFNGKAVTCGLFSSSGTGTRTITLNSGSLTVAWNSGTVWTTSTSTNLTWTTRPSVNFTYSGGTGTRTIIGSQTEDTAIDVNITAGTDIVSLSGTSNVVNFTGFAGSLASATRTITGGLTISTGMSITASASTTTLAGASGTKVLTSNGKTLDFPIAVNTTGATWQLADNLTMGSTRAFTLTAGTIDLNAKTLSAGSFSSNNGNTRTITPNGGGITVSNSNAILVNVTNSTGFTPNGVVITSSYTGSVGSRTFVGANTGPSQTTTVNIAFSGGTDSVECRYAFNDLNYTNFSGTRIDPTSQNVVYGNLTFTSGMTVGAESWLLKIAGTSGTKVITTNGKSLTQGFDFNCAGATVQFADDFTTSAGIVHTAGVMDINGKTVTTSNFDTGGSTAREIKSSAAGGKIATTVTIPSASAFDAAPSTNLTVTRNSWTIEIGGNTTSLRTIDGGGATWPALIFTNTTANGELDFLNGASATATFKSISVSTPPQTLKFTAGMTVAIEDDDGFPSGTSGNLITITSTTMSQHNLVKSGGGSITRDYLSISYSVATPSRTWLAGSHSTNGGNNSGWRFADTWGPLPGGIILF